MGIFGIDPKANPGKLRDMKDNDLRRAFDNTCKVHCKISNFSRNIKFIDFFSLQPPWIRRSQG